MCLVVDRKIHEAANILKDVAIKKDEFVDERFFPPKDSDPETVARYFFFMVAIDHRTTIKGSRFEGLVEGEFYKGADLLFRLGAKKLMEDPSFFSPQKMAEIDVETLKKWLKPDEPRWVTLPDPDIRVMLLRDAGVKLMRLYSGKVMELVNRSGSYLYTDNKDGFIDRLKVFKAYEDPVEKKAFLLVKFLLRRGLVNFKDIENLQLPIDNHLTRIAIRLGLVRVLGMEKKEVSREEDIAIRLVVRRAYKVLAKEIGLREDILDDFLWVHGRTCCTPDTPHCDKCKNPISSSENCPLRKICEAYKLGEFPNEHVHEETWYY